MVMFLCKKLELMRLKNGKHGGRQFAQKTKSTLVSLKKCALLGATFHLER